MEEGAELSLNSYYKMMELCDEQVDVLGIKVMLSELQQKGAIDSKALNLYLSTALNAIQEEASVDLSLSKKELLTRSNACILSILAMFDASNTAPSFETCEMIISHYITLHGLSIATDLIFSLHPKYLTISSQLLNYLIYQTAIECGNVSEALNLVQRAKSSKIQVDDTCWDIILNAALEENELDVFKAAWSMCGYRKLDSDAHENLISLMIAKRDFSDLSRVMPLSEEQYELLFLSIVKDPVYLSSMPSILHSEEQKEVSYGKLSQVLKLLGAQNLLDKSAKNALLKIFSAVIPPVSFLDFLDKEITFSHK